MIKQKIWKQASKSKGLWGAMDTSDCQGCKAKNVECIKVCTNVVWDKLDYQYEYKFVELCKKCFFKGEHDEKM